jgi:hypothetical protein
MSGIYDKVRLNPAQARTVADRRLADADYLGKSDRNIHANGAMYLGGIALECFLKAKLLERHAWLQHPPEDIDNRSSQERELYRLCYVEHNLARLQERLSGEPLKPLERAGLLPTLKELCGEWTIHVRYSPKMAPMRDARNFLSRIKELKRWLM